MLKKLNLNKKYIEFLKFNKNDLLLNLFFYFMLIVPMFVYIIFNDFKDNFEFLYPFSLIMFFLIFLIKIFNYFFFLIKF